MYGYRRDGAGGTVSNERWTMMARGDAMPTQTWVKSKVAERWPRDSYLVKRMVFKREGERRV